MKELSCLRQGAARRAAIVAALGVVAGSLAVGASPALADHKVAHKVEREAEPAQLIANRVSSLNAAISEVQGRPFLGPDAISLVDHMQADITGLQQLASAISGATTTEQARLDRSLIFTQYRVYHLVLPVANLVVATDFVNNVELADLNQDLTQLQGFVNSYNQGVLGPLVSDAQNEISFAANATSGLSAQLLDYTAAQWDSDHSLLSGARTELKHADHAVRLASKDLARAESYLSRPILGSERGDQGNQQPGDQGNQQPGDQGNQQPGEQGSSI